MAKDLSRYKEYANDVVTGKIPSCHYIHKACERYLSWFDRDDIYFDPEAADKVIRYFGKLKHFKGAHAKKPFVQEKWQVWITSWIYGFKRKEDKMRVVRNVYISVPRKNGKDLDINTPIPTPDGWTTIGALTKGDVVYGCDGKPTEVIDVTGIQHNRCYELTFEDGEKVIAGEEHNWFVKDSYCGEKVKQTRDLVNCRKTRRDGKGFEYRYRIPMPKPIERPYAELPVDPYMLGFWLGDGHRAKPVYTINGDDLSEVLNYFTLKTDKISKYKDKNAYTVNYGGDKGKDNSELRHGLTEIGVLFNKHIPYMYLNSSIEQRMSLLQGIMDSDGYVSKAGECEITQKNKALSDGICELLGSLGIKYGRKTKKPTIGGTACDEVELITFFTDKSKPCFRLKRKYDRLKDSLSERMKWKSIVSVREVDTVPTKCIQVSNPDGLFLFGRKYSVTHNSALCAGYATYHLCSDKEAGASVIIGASSATQAQMMFEVCQKFLQPFGKIFKRYRDSIKFPAMDSKLQVVSSNVQAIEGENASAYFIDEIEMQPDSKLYDTLSTSTVARTQPLGFVIGTAGFDTDGFAYSMLRMHKEILDGTLDDDTSVGILYEPDEGDDPYEDDENRTILKKTNPNLDVSCRADAIDGEMRKAKNNPRLKASVLMRHFDMWQNSSMEWIPEKFIISNMDKVSLPDYAEESVYLGYDLSAAKDLTCLSACIHSGDRYIFKTWYWCSQWAVDESVNKQLYRMWADNGYITVCPGRTIDYDFIHNKIEELGERYFIPYIGYDPWNAVQLSKKLTDEGKPMIPYGMNMANMNRPMKEFEVKILNDSVIIDKNPVTKWCLKNTCLKIDRNENIYPVKTNAENKIDGMVAMMIAYGVCLQNEYPSEFVSVALN